MSSTACSRQWGFPPSLRGASYSRGVPGSVNRNSMEGTTGDSPTDTSCNRPASSRPNRYPHSVPARITESVSSSKLIAHRVGTRDRHAPQPDRQRTLRLRQRPTQGCRLVFQERRHPLQLGHPRRIQFLPPADTHSPAPPCHPIGKHPTPRASTPASGPYCAGAAEMRNRPAHPGVGAGGDVMSRDTTDLS